jgi:hypothetical protein
MNSSIVYSTQDGETKQKLLVAVVVVIIIVVFHLPYFSAV